MSFLTYIKFCFCTLFLLHVSIHLSWSQYYIILSTIALLLIGFDISKRKSSVIGWIPKGEVNPEIDISMHGGSLGIPLGIKICGREKKEVELGRRRSWCSPCEGRSQPHWDLWNWDHPKGDEGLDLEPQHWSVNYSGQGT